jgi:protoporphyrinogen oxidase
MQKENYIIVGSGISGLLSALITVRKNKNAKVYIVEKNKEIGGLLRRFYYGEEYGSFDYGMHNLLETGEKELDDLIFSLLPENEWQLLEGKKRDLAGVFFNDVLQYNTPYIDIRNLGEEEAHKCISNFFTHINKQPFLNKEEEVLKNVEQYAFDRFGEYTALKTVIPSVEKVHQKSAKELDYMAGIFTPMSRIAMFDEPLINDVTKSDVLRDRIAFSDQRNLPLAKSSGRKAFYPAKYGMYRVIEGFVKELKKYDVEFLDNSELKTISIADDKINGVTILNEYRTIEVENISRFIWTGGVPILGKLLNITMNDLGFDKALKTTVVSILIDKPLNMGDLYYFFCYQPGFHTYRLNNFTAYCDQAPRNGYYPLSIELLMSDQEISAVGKTFEEIAIDELQKFKILQPDTKIVFTKAEPLDSGFPMPSVKNIQSLNTIRNRIKNLQLKNLDMFGILAEPNLFFQTDVLRHTYLN